jgi:hypothetical protein
MDMDDVYDDDDSQSQSKSSNNDEDEEDEIAADLLDDSDEEEDPDEEDEEDEEEESFIGWTEDRYGNRHPLSIDHNANASNNGKQHIYYENNHNHDNDEMDQEDEEGEDDEDDLEVGGLSPGQQPLLSRDNSHTSLNLFSLPKPKLRLTEEQQRRKRKMLINGLSKIAGQIATFDWTTRLEIRSRAKVPVLFIL